MSTVAEIQTRVTNATNLKEVFFFFLPIFMEKVFNSSLYALLKQKMNMIRQMFVVLLIYLYVSRI